MKPALTIICILVLSAAQFTVAAACLIPEGIAPRVASTGGSVNWLPPCEDPPMYPVDPSDLADRTVAASDSCAPSFPGLIYPSTPDNDDIITFFEPFEYWYTQCNPSLVPHLGIDHDARIVHIDIEVVPQCGPGEGGAQVAVLVGIGLYGTFGPLEPGVWALRSDLTSQVQQFTVVPEPRALPVLGLGGLLIARRRTPKQSSRVPRCSKFPEAISVSGLLIALIGLSAAVQMHWTLPRLDVTRDPVLDKLAFAIEARDADGLGRLLEEPSLELDDPGDAGLPPLARAARAGWFEGCRLLIQYGAAVNVSDGDGTTPLMYAVRGDDDAARQIAEFLIQHGADLEARSRVGTTALTWAVMLRNDALVKLLLDAGADPQPAGAQGDTPLDIARRADYRELAALLEARMPKAKQ